MGVEYLMPARGHSWRMNFMDRCAFERLFDRVILALRALRETSPTAR